MASVLVIAADPNIESLIGQLVAFAGHRPIFDATLGAAGEAVRRARPDVVVLDTMLPGAVVRSCLDAASEVAARPILTSSSASEAELAHDAEVRHLPYFALPGGPKPLADLIDHTLRADDRLHAGNGLSRSVRGNSAMCAALAGMARARALRIRTMAVVAENQALRDERRELLDETQRSRGALRAAVSDYARQLKRSSIDEADAIALVCDAISDCAAVVGAEGLPAAIVLESEEWAREVYRAA